MKGPGLNGLPTWAKVIAVVGIPGFLALFLVGAIPFLPSPIGKIQEMLQTHAEESREQARAIRVICHVLAEGHPLKQLCGPVP